MNRLGYIGSKYRLKDWIFSEIEKHASGYRTFADLFAGTCIMTHEALGRGYDCVSNDLEMYSYVVSRGIQCCFNEKLANIIEKMNSLEGTDGFIMKNYSPVGNRKFFTQENARKIDHIREHIELIKDDISEDDYYFLLASLITSADVVKNTSVIYGAYLKEFKKSAIRSIVLKPLHTRTSSVKLKSLHEDATKLDISVDIAYIDPPYNGRQYGANYFVLNQILFPKPLNESSITGVCEYKTSSFCRKSEVIKAFEDLMNNIHAKVFVISYNSESLVPIDDLTSLMKKHGRCVLIEKEYKRFKAQQMETKEVKEFLIFVYIDKNE